MTETDYLAADIGGTAKVKKKRKMKAGRFVPPTVGESAPSSAEPSVLTAPSAMKTKKVKKRKKAEQAQKSQTLAQEDMAAELAETETVMKSELKDNAGTSTPSPLGDNSKLTGKAKASTAALVPPSAENCKRKRKTKALQPDTEERGDTTKAKRLKASSSEALPPPSPAASAAYLQARYRKDHDIVVGKECPEAFQTFAVAEVHIGRILTKALLKQRYTAPTPIQAQSWPIALRGDDIVAVSKTGSGKTCGFIVPALLRISKFGATPEKIQAGCPDDRAPASPSVLVLAPTRELAQQIETEANKFAHLVEARVATIYGGVAKGEQISQLRSGVDILISTTGRLLDFMSGHPSRNLPPTVTLGSVSYLVLDEADKMLDMGFEPDIRKIAAECKASGTRVAVLAGTARQTLFFTATWPKAVHRAAASLTSPKAMQIRIGQGAGDRLTANANVTQKVFVLPDRNKVEKLQQVLTKTLQHGETAIVFAARKVTCDFLQERLSWDPRSGEPIICGWAKAIHGDKEQWERDEVLTAFRAMTTNPRNSQKGVLIATDVAARGLDIPGVALVVVYDFGSPSLSSHDSGIESYVHRIGRTGRAGKGGTAVTLFTPNDVGSYELAQLIREAGQEVPSDLQKLAEKAGPFKGKGKGSGKGKSKGKGKGKGKGKSKGKGKK